MKKALMILLGVALVFSMAGIGTADQVLTQSVSSGTVDVTYSVGETYEVTIPDAITVNSNSYSVGLRSAAIIESDEWLNVYVNSTNSWVLEEVNAAHSVAYTMSVTGLVYTSLPGTTIESKTYELTSSNPGEGKILVYSAKGGTLNTKSDLRFGITGSVQHSGTYKDTLTFTIEVEDLSETQTALDAVNALLVS